MSGEAREMVHAERQALEANVRAMKVRHGMDKESLEILEMVKEGAEGKLVDVDVEANDGEHVKVEVIVEEGGEQVGMRIRLI